MSAQTPSPVNALVSNVCDVLQPAVNSTHPRAEVFNFLYREGRLPKIGDERAPWTYCGWMLPYVISLHAHPFFGKSLDDNYLPANSLTNPFHALNSTESLKAAYAGFGKASAKVLPDGATS